MTINLNNPYSVLGVSENATDEQVKEAYRNLAKKYHPDAYADNPLADLASEKMKEINEAYDQIQSERKNGRSQGSYSGGYSHSSKFADVRSLLGQKRISDAEELLDGVPSNERDAEWYFLKGNVQYMKGWTEEAYKNFSAACNMDPGNMEYRSAMNRVNFQRGGGMAGGYHTGGNASSDCTACDMCQGLICADCCCECMGGDLIRCC